MAPEPQLHVPSHIQPSQNAEQIIDFTCATPWERLALDIELELRSWGVHDSQTPPDYIPITSRNISHENTGGSVIDPPPIISTPMSLGDTRLCLELRVAPPNDSLDSFPLERLLGVNQCIMITSASPDAILANDASDATIYLSALAVAASACACSLPMLVPVGRPSSLRFLGRQLHPSHSRFTCDYTYEIPDKSGHLAGLLSLFSNKRASARPRNASTLSCPQISAKFTYDWTDFSFKLAPAQGSFASERRLSAVQSDALARSDPITKIRVVATWDAFSASDLECNKMPAAMPAVTASRIRLSLPTEFVRTISGSAIPSARIPMTAAAKKNLRLAQLTSKQSDAANPAAPLPVINVHKRLNSSLYDTSVEENTYALNSQGLDDPNSPRVAQPPTLTALDDFLIQVGDYVAAAAIQDDRIDEEFLTSAVAALFQMDLGRGIMVDVMDALGPNAVEMTVLERVSRLVAASETLNAAQKLWNLFLDGVEVHWEQQWIVGGVPFSARRGPDHDESLVTQKLQMINCCIERRRREASGLAVSLTGLDKDGLGRKKVCEGVELIGNGELGVDRQVWEPYVQPHQLVTRDMVDEELKRMVSRAERGEGNDETEAKRQSLTLKSDMMAFKAANPNASMADFVRWFSPSDWISGNDERENAHKKGGKEEGDIAIEDEEALLLESDSWESMRETDDSHCENENGNGTKPKRSGRLSARMSRRGNIWEELWKGAESVAASRQVSLFDAAAHGSKALGDLRAMPVTQVILHLALVQCGSTARVLQEAFSRPPQLSSVQITLDRARHSVREACSNLGLYRIDEAERAGVAAAVEMVGVAEHIALIATSVVTKLPPVDGLGLIIDQLASGECASVEKERAKQLVIRMAGLDDGGWQSIVLPEWREFLIRGLEGTDRMYARLSSDEFRVGFRLGMDYGV